MLVACDDIADVDNMRPTTNFPGSCFGAEYAHASKTICQTDNRDLTYGFGSGTSSQRAYIRSILEGQFEPTVLSVSEENPPVYSGSAETDIIYQIGATLPKNTNGLTWCNNAASSKACDQHYVRLKPGRVGPGMSTVCHESGHAVGLTHGSDAAPAISSSHPSLACLRTPGTSDETLGIHNRGQINGTY